ncbi:hypothetical protein J3A72_003147 [Stenotrophomonas sp. PvP093]|jgi:hypothetical protein|uniref:Uncharacterized protein n=1 Tax=Stenotrophomonas pavanii TaxID=487698 RepID=A0A2D0APL1_9GAMM|nr:MULTISPECIES: hypothetical protein [Stenotrophomonas]MBP2482855.1 hypothetical protein [Stenotrophomonas sp. PvP093]OWR35224.1 hypothetical protein CEE55_02120 [Stenotrophomonas pavanii]
MLEALLVATAKAVPAAAGYDWKWMVPVATLILGFGLKWFQDHVTEKGRRRHETVLRREQRYDQLRMRRLDAERANLLALQPAAVRFVRAATVAVNEKRRLFRDGMPWAGIHLAGPVEAEVRQSALELIPLQARIHSKAVSVPLNDVINLITAALHADTVEGFEAAWAVLDPANNELHRVTGETIKQLEDENQQLADPPGR